MAEYTLDRSLTQEDFDWPAFIETLDLDEPFGENYRIIPLNLPLLAEDMEKIRKGYTATDFASKYDLASFETKIVWDGRFFTVDEGSVSWHPRRNEAWEYCHFHKLWCWVEDILYFANWLVIADNPDGASARLAVDRPAADERLLVIPLRNKERATPLRRKGSCTGVDC